jgi:glycosyltransferase involved in cell wall biosynthesis
LTNSKYNIFYLSSTSDIGGTERMLIQLLSRIDRARFDCFVCSLIGSGKLSSEIRELGFESESLGLNYPFQLIKMYKLFKLMKSGKFDLIQTYGLRADTLGRILGRIAKIPVIVSSIRSTDPWRKKYHVMIDRGTLSFADFFISNSEAGKISRIKREKYPRDLISVIHNGIAPVYEFSSEEIKDLRKEFGIEDNHYPVISMVANLRIMKGHRDVIKAIPELKNKYPDILFLFAGRDDSNGEIKKMAGKTGVLRNIRFLGYSKEPEKVVAASGIFLLPSLWEGCPTSLVEAMAQKKPCIATKVGGIPEIIIDKENGILIPPGDPPSIKNAVIFLADNREEAAKMAASAGETYSRRFTLKKMVKKYETIYSELIDKKKT